MPRSGFSLCAVSGMMMPDGDFSSAESYGFTKIRSPEGLNFRVVFLVSFSYEYFVLYKSDNVVARNPAMET